MMTPLESASPANLEAIQETVIKTRQFGTACRLSDWSVLVVSGTDAGKYLQSQTSNDVLKLEVGQGHLNALLDRKALIQSLFSLHRLDVDTYWLLLETMQLEATLARLDQFLFTEDVNLQALENTEIYTVQGPNGLAWLHQEDQEKHLTGPMLEYEIQNNPVKLIRRSLTGEPGYWLIPGAEALSRFDTWFKDSTSAFGFAPLTPKALAILQMESGQLRFGIEATAEMALPATGLEQTAVSYEKGCYPGQEVVAKVRTYGSIAKALMGLIFEGGVSLPQAGSLLTVNGKAIGEVHSSAFSPTLNASIATASIAREYRVPNQQITVEIDGISNQVTPVFLPFYKSLTDTERAEQAYEQALALFAEHNEDRAIPLLRQALQWAPRHTDATESLGVMLSRQEKYEEAIAVMKHLAELDPEAVMPHTNLSVFYMKLGDKETAETEKAIATTLTFKQAMAKSQLAKVSAEAETAKSAELTRKASMFEEVLELDPEDALANFGLGNTYLDLNQPEKALPFLKRAVELDPRHTVSYAKLGKALESVKQIDEAKAIYTIGIEVAAKRGDWMPMQEMERRLASLS